MATTSPSPGESRRVEFIDLLRGWAVIVMIETHVMNATLRSDITAGGVFQYVKFLNGLVAPSFLFASGLAWAITARRKHAEYTTPGAGLRRQCARLLMIAAVGYLLHLPKFSLGKLLYDTTGEEWRSFFMVDILQCIAVSLLAMQILLFVHKSERRMYSSLMGITVVMLWATPLLWGFDFWSVMPWPVAAYLNGVHYSLFPLFPWSVFLFAGALFGYAYLRARDRAAAGSAPGALTGMMRMVPVWAIALIAASVLLEPVLSGFYPVYDYWRYSPGFVLIRIGLVLLLAAGMFWYEHRRDVAPGSIVTLLGRHSLMVYALHLMLIYGTFGSYSFHRWAGRTFGYGEALVTTGVLLVAMISLALGMTYYSKQSLRLRTAVRWSAGGLFLGVFVFGFAA